MVGAPVVSGGAGLEEVVRAGQSGHLGVLRSDTLLTSRLTSRHTGVVEGETAGGIFPDCGGVMAVEVDLSLSLSLSPDSLSFLLVFTVGLLYLLLHHLGQGVQSLHLPLPLV